ncbi:MAG: DinB family protein [Gemmatimonadaceae bacterium]
MAIRDALLPEFDTEMASTRKVLERVPIEKADYKPHAKSGSLGWLAWHVADLPHWVVETVNKEELDFAPPGAPRPAPPKVDSRDTLLASFDEKVAAARTAIAGASDDHLAKTWTLKAGGKTIFSMPRSMVLRSFVMNHMIHHRAQLGVYLRLNDVPVPGMYGPSADEKGG